MTVDNAPPSAALSSSGGPIPMILTPNTLGVMLLFLAVFLACILWATHGATASAGSEEENIQAPGKAS